MNKQELLKNIAKSGYNIGFGAKKHFATYDLYRLFPRTLSFIILAIGVIQLTCTYKQSVSSPIFNDVFAVVLILGGLLSLIIDFVGTNKNKIEISAKELINLFNQLRSLYYEVKTDEDNLKCDIYFERLKAIEEQAKNIALSDLAIGINLYTHWAFFGGSTQIDWIDEQLNFKIQDKFPFLHYEAFILYIILWFFAFKPLLHLIVSTVKHNFLLH